MTVNKMTANLRLGAALADRIADGDLTVDHTPASDKDTLGLALVRMVERLRTVVGDSSAAAENVSSGSQELSSSADQVSQGATEQAAAAEEASASMEQMASNIKQNADNAAQTEKIARQSSKDAEASGVAVDKAVVAMRTIAEKIGIVQEIARQTDLLALTQPSRRRVPANMAAASRWWRPRCASWPSVARARPPRSARCRPTR